MWAPIPNCLSAPYETGSELEPQVQLLAGVTCAVQPVTNESVALPLLAVALSGIRGAMVAYRRRAGARLRPFALLFLLLVLGFGSVDLVLNAALAHGETGPLVRVDPRDTSAEGLAAPITAITNRVASAIRMVRRGCGSASGQV